MPQAFVPSLWAFIALRFCTGFCLAGMLPSVNSLLRRYALKGMESRTYSYLNCAYFFGGMAGSVGMGALGSSIGLPIIFITSGALLLLCMLWMRVTVFAHVTNAKTGGRIE